MCREIYKTEGRSLRWVFQKCSGLQGGSLLQGFMALYPQCYYVSLLVLINIGLQDTCVLAKILPFVPMFSQYYPCVPLATYVAKPCLPHLKSSISTWDYWMQEMWSYRNIDICQKVLFGQHYLWICKTIPHKNGLWPQIKYWEFLFTQVPLLWGQSHKQH